MRRLLDFDMHVRKEVVQWLAFWYCWRACMCGVKRIRSWCSVWTKTNVFKHIREVEVHAHRQTSFPWCFYMLLSVVCCKRNCPISCRIVAMLVFVRQWQLPAINRATKVFCTCTNVRIKKNDRHGHEKIKNKNKQTMLIWNLGISPFWPSGCSCLDFCRCLGRTRHPRGKCHLSIAREW